MSHLLKIICVLIFLFSFFSTFGLQMAIILIAGFITFGVIVAMVSSNQSSTNVRQTIVPLQVPPNESPKGPAKESFSDDLVGSHTPVAGYLKPALKPNEGQTQVIVLACIAFFVGFSLVLGYLPSEFSKRPLETIPQKTSPAPYAILAIEDFSLAGRHRVSLRVLIQDRSATNEAIRAALLEAAQRQDADAVMAFAYWPGDNWTSAYTAGRLEWGKNGGGWASTTRLPTDGSFDAGERPFTATRTAELQQGTANDILHLGNPDIDKELLQTFVKDVLIPTNQKVDESRTVFRRLKQKMIDGAASLQDEVEFRSLQDNIFECDKHLRRKFKELKDRLTSSETRKVVEKVELDFLKAIGNATQELPYLKYRRDLDIATSELQTINSKLDQVLRKR
jgi:hypothetical protein